MARVLSFPPISAANAKVLILGSMPGERSLAASEYYAHPQNAFWKILGSLLGFSSTAPYRQRVEEIKAARIAVWDVLKSCHRKGSLDSKIDRESCSTNGFRRFFQQHPDISCVCLNGSTAASLFSSLVLPTLGEVGLTLIKLPSTSPANAAMSLNNKLALWQAALARGGVECQPRN